MKFNRLIICMMVIARYMVKLQSAEKNPAYMCPDLPGIVFMQYTEKGETYFTIVSVTDYKKIKTEYWLGTNNYVSTCRDGKTVYLHREEWSESRLVFPNTRGNMVHNRNLQNSLYRIFAKAGIEGATMHTLRHTYATRCFEAGVDIKAISEQLGHANVKTTYNIYVHLLEDTKEKEIDKLEGIDRLLA